MYSVRVQESRGRGTALINNTARLGVSWDTRGLESGREKPFQGTYLLVQYFGNELLGAKLAVLLVW